MAKSSRQSSSIFAITLGVVLSSLILCDAAPLTSRNLARSSWNTTTPTPPVTTGTSGQPLATIYPEYTSQYNGRDGAVDFDTAQGLVSRSPTNGGADISTLVTFTVGTQYGSNICQLVFDLTNPGSSASGSLKTQIFTSLAPATADAASWPNGNLRDQELGSIDLVVGGRATWEQGSGPGATNNGFFPCSSIAGQIYGGEIVPQGDTDEVSWTAGQDGIKIIVW
ncbi:hypothetical protein A1O3_03298 [Capronia epimyces CBS 606.96]|uniref:Ubiquitin 3 binding protein But2 C-terminal domain-containing protein n=1 Tax=Capronia epimyces CBS 606.96 TaxID=1182542 RepID=W9Y0P9_9EURO|nr:uncharacterized protein A1O3_03298 [Capronia epimyces CBS 606.96]EXJ86347.1 hypothetical protein A1O3_03298 [Capronia epimyces CBS 606.96]